MSTYGVSGRSAEKLLSGLKNIQSEAKSLQSTLDAKPGNKQSGGLTFVDHLKLGVDQVNTNQLKADKLTTDVATGASGSIHEAMLAATKADLSFKLMVQIRNKALEAYTEVMRMPV